MDITEEERGWALAIKEALQKKDAELANSVTDFEYAHHAIIAKEKVAKALKRIKRLHAFRKDHGVPGGSIPNAERALQTIQQYEASSPGYNLSFGKDTKENIDADGVGGSSYVVVWDFAAFLPANYQKPEDWQMCFAAFHYMLDAMQPDFSAIRAGIIVVSDAENLGWKNFSLEMEKHAAHLYQDAYPLRITKMIMLHTPTIFKAMYNLCKPFLSKKVKNSIEPNGKLDQIQERFARELLPTTMGGVQTTREMEENTLEALKTRYANMASFNL